MSKPKLSINLQGQEALLKTLAEYDAVKPALISRALKAGASVLKGGIKASVAGMTDGARTKKGAVVTRTVDGWRAKARGPVGAGLDVPIFTQIRAAEESRLMTGKAVENAFKGGDQKTIEKEMAKVKKALNSFSAKKLAGKAWRKFKKLRGDAMMEKGETGMLYKSIDIKYLKPIREGRDADGVVRARTGVASRFSESTKALLRWRTLTPNKKTAFVGPRHMVVVAFNPWTRTLERVDQARYAHLVENGHLIKVRGKNLGRVKGRPFVMSTMSRMRGNVLAAMSNVLRTELKSVLQSKDAGVILDGMR